MSLARLIRLQVIEASRRANVGHIGSALSVAELVSVLFGSVLTAPAAHADRDRFVLSKGHAALALYAALQATGRLDASDIEGFCTDGTPLGAHPDHAVDGIDFSTGSLGHGLSIAAGAALAGRILRSSRRAFALLSDAECDEGSTWEAAMFAAHHRLSNLIALIDLNGQQALGYTKDVLDLDPLAQRWSSFGWDVHELDGHDERALVSTIEQLDIAAGPPHILLCQTVFGKGVSFMESRIDWHYLPLNDEQYDLALAELV